MGVNGTMARVGTVRRALWLPPVVTAGLVWLAYRAGYQDEAFSRAAAESTVAGILIAAPFALVALVQVACALFATLAETKRQLWMCVLASSLGGASLTLAVVTLDGTPGVRHDVVVGTAMLLPLLPAWISMVASHRVVEPSQR